MEQKLIPQPQPPPCQRHNMKDYCKHFCRDCNELMCSYCLQTERHRCHQIIEYQEYFLQQKQITEKQFHKAKDLLSKAKELQKSISKSKKIQQQKFDKDGKEVENFQGKVTSEFDEWYKRKMKKLQDIKRAQTQTIVRARDEIKQLACSDDSINIVEDQIQSHVEDAWASIVVPEIKVNKTELQRTVHKYTPQLRFSATRHQGLYDTLSLERQLRPVSFPEYSSISFSIPPVDSLRSRTQSSVSSVSGHFTNDSRSFSSVNSTNIPYPMSFPVPSSQYSINEGNDSLKRAPNDCIHDETHIVHTSESAKQYHPPSRSPSSVSAPVPPSIPRLRTLSSGRMSNTNTLNKEQLSEGTSFSSLTSRVTYSMSSTNSSNQSSIMITADSLKAAPSDFVNLHDVCITPQQDIIISDPSNHCLRVLRIDKGSLIQDRVIDCGECEPSAIACNSETGKLLMVDRSAISQSPIKKINLTKSNLPRNFPFSAVKCPGGLAFGYDTDHKMCIYVLDTVDGSVFIVSNKGKVRNKISMQPMPKQSSLSSTSDLAASSTCGMLNACPVGITTGLASDAYGSNPYFVIADISNRCIRKFSLQAELWGSKKMKSQQDILKHPFAVTTVTQGITAVADSKNHRVSFFSAKGDLIKHLGGTTNDENIFSNPRSIAYCDKDQCLVVLDDGDKKVKVFFLQDVFR